MKLEFIMAANCLSKAITYFIGKKKKIIVSTTIFCGESNTSISIGDICLLSRSINNDTSDFHSIVDHESKKRNDPLKNVTFGNKFWIGFIVSINKGTVINDKLMVAVRSLLTGKAILNKNAITGGIGQKF